MIPLRFLSRLVLVSIVLGVGDLLALEAEAGLGSFFNGMASRSRVVQFCIVTMGVALLILLKKFSFHDAEPRAFVAKMNYAPTKGDKLTR